MLENNVLVINTGNAFTQIPLKTHVLAYVFGSLGVRERVDLDHISVILSGSKSSGITPLMTQKAPGRKRNERNLGTCMKAANVSLLVFSVCP